MSGHILIVDDERDATERLAQSLRSRGYRVTTVHEVAAGIASLDELKLDVVLTGLDVGGDSGLELCARVVDKYPNVPVVLVTDHGTLDAAVQALRVGAFDFLTAPVDVEQLHHRIERALNHRDLLAEVRRLRRASTDAPGSASMFGESPAMNQLFAMVDRLADSDVNVLITGESGVGKELVARRLHAQGTDAEGPFVAVNCAAVPANLIESELFGHVRGAFTDAKRRRDGLFVRADGGTLFLDEIGELPMEMQPKLLRVLQERRVTPVGGEREILFDTRIISATNRDLDEDVEAGRFREDLYYRVNVVHLPVPPLRERGTDILRLAQRFISEAAQRTGRGVRGLSAAAAAQLMAYDWPGNVRELENAMERAVALAGLDEIQIGDLPPRIRSHSATHELEPVSDHTRLITLEELEARYIQRVLDTVNGNKTQAARILGVGRRTLYRRLARLEGDPQVEAATA